MSSNQVTVTAEDIREGMRECMTRCPIARAIDRTFNTISLVGTNVYYVGANRFRTAPLMGQWMMKFDTRKDVYPFSWVVPALTYALTLESHEAR